MTAFEIPEEIYKEYCTPDEAKFGKENKNQRKVRIQRIFLKNGPSAKPNWQNMPKKQ